MGVLENDFIELVGKLGVTKAIRLIGDIEIESDKKTVKQLIHKHGLCFIEDIIVEYEWEVVEEDEGNPEFDQIVNTYNWIGNIIGRDYFDEAVEDGLFRLKDLKKHRYYFLTINDDLSVASISFYDDVKRCKVVLDDLQKEPGIRNLSYRKYIVLDIIEQTVFNAF